VGILIYEMMASYTPFYHMNQLKMFEKIVRGRYKFPTHFSNEARMLVDALLQHKPTQRLGVTKGEASVIKQHPWFKGFEWEMLEQKKYVAPDIPTISNLDDLSNFEFAGAGRPVQKYVDDGSNWDADF
jgi:serine/threonine protein kinase